MVKKVVMEAIHERVAGLDVHKQSVMACRRKFVWELSGRE